MSYSLSLRIREYFTKKEYLIPFHFVFTKLFQTSFYNYSVIFHRVGLYQQQFLLQQYQDIYKLTPLYLIFLKRARTSINAVPTPARTSEIIKVVFSLAVYNDRKHLEVPLFISWWSVIIISILSVICIINFFQKMKFHSQL